MSFKAEIIADSVSDAGIRLVTFQVTFPRFILAEFNTHRVFSRNSASSRAIPLSVTIKKVEQNPFIFESWGKNQKGMSSEEELSEWESRMASAEWRAALKDAIRHAEQLESLGVHKQFANRLLEPFSWHTALVTATEWSNFFALRTDKNAQPEFRKLAVMMQEIYESQHPWVVKDGEWHLPLTGDFSMEDFDGDWDPWKKISTGRCARVSYLTHDGKRDPEVDIALHDRLKTNGHLSPFEHVARPFNDNEWIYSNPFCGNFRGWHQYRKDISNEDDFSKVVTDEALA